MKKITVAMPAGTRVQERDGHGRDGAEGGAHQRDEVGERDPQRRALLGTAPRAMSRKMYVAVPAITLMTRLPNM